MKLKASRSEESLQNSTAFKSACLQWDLFRGRGVVGSEDCLFLNIYRLYEEAETKNADNFSESPKAHAVMVFFHGVGFIAGHPDTYNPEYLVQKGVIVVTVQYRLGALGFLSSGDKRQPGNMGLLDQVMALHWIQENIKWFGGDANRVTIFGESAGAVAVTLHLCSPLTKGMERINSVYYNVSIWIAAYKLQYRFCVVFRPVCQRNHTKRYSPSSVFRTKKTYATFKAVSSKLGLSF